LAALCVCPLDLGLRLQKTKKKTKITGNVMFDDPATPPLALEYVMFHEMLHLRHGVDHHGVRRRVHTREFRQAEQAFPRLKEAKALLKEL